MGDTALELLAKMLVPVIEQEKARQFGLQYREGLKHDSGADPITSGFRHGPGGRLTYPGVVPILFNNAMGFTGILGQLPATPSVYTNPTYMTVTGITDDTGEEKD